MATKKEEQTGSEMVIIQSRLNAPKNQFNKFGGYSYRSCEDILEALKPLLKETGCVLTISDEIIQVADRIYVKATATLTTGAGQTFTTSAYAREPQAKKGMDDSQITGSTSSYARKYALNGLFCIDDNKDADTLNVDKEFSQPANAPATAKTPAPAPAPPKAPTPTNAQLEEQFQLILPNIKTAPSKQYLHELHESCKSLYDYPPYKNAMNKRYKEVD